MNPRHLLFILMLGCLLLLPPAWSWSRLGAANQALIAAAASYEHTRGQATELLALRAGHDHIADRKRPEDHVLAHVNRVLAEAGLPSRSLQGVHPEADTALAGASSSNEMQYRRQSVRLSLHALTLTEIGAFLLRWREDNSIWRPSRIELTKHRSRSEDDDRYDAAIIISAVYLSETSR